jgi:hypothetical protein
MEKAGSADRRRCRIEPFEYRKDAIRADAVTPFERTPRIAQAQPHRCIEVRRRRNALLRHFAREIDDAGHDARCDVAGGVRDHEGGNPFGCEKICWAACTATEVAGEVISVTPFMLLKTGSIASALMR